MIDLLTISADGTEIGKCFRIREIPTGVGIVGTAVNGYQLAPSANGLFKRPTRDGRHWLHFAKIHAIGTILYSIGKHRTKSLAKFAIG